MTEDLTATYRLHLHKDFTLDQAADILPYLKALNISDIYLSPIFESVPGSTHGYDVSDFTKISVERGGEKGFTNFASKIAHLNLRFLLDIVPNHMGIGGLNPFWIDVLANGPASRYRSLFDLRPDEDGKIHLPVLSGTLDNLIQEGKVSLTSHPHYGRGVSVAGAFFPLNEESRDDTSGDMAALLGRQHYSLVQWTEAFDKLSYRRFFDITGLIGMRVEDPEVYAATHKFLFSLLKKYPSIRGVRVDHIDGLADPASYLQTLRKDCADIWIEKILSSDERLPAAWPVRGTTGYEFINQMNGLFIHPDGYKILEEAWTSSIEPKWKNFHECVRDSKGEALHKLFPSELKRLVDLSGGDPSQAGLFWQELTKELDVYRTYAGAEPLSAEDKDRIARAVERASVHIGPEFDAAASVYLPRLLDPQDDKDRQVVREWQQLSGPAMAKGLEDTAHYRFTPFVAMNEVGCPPALPSGQIPEYMDWMNGIAGHYPHSLLATSTHDTKRSEDVRHRLYALADMPGDWLEFFKAAQDMNKPLRQNLSIRSATEYFLYQNLLGVWPFDHRIDQGFIDRIAAYMQKSVKEARTETSWLEPDKVYEDDLAGFINRILKSDSFLSLARNFASRLFAPGVLNSLSVLTLKILGGGTPDIYQGNVCWDFSLVDPDNRRPVDFRAREKALSDLEALSEKEEPGSVLGNLLSHWQDHKLKMWMTRTLLSIRKSHLSGPKTFMSLTLSGEDSDMVIAYKLTCTDSRNTLVIACPRYAGRIFPSFPPSLSFSLKAGLDLERNSAFENLLTGKQVSHSGRFDIGEMFRDSPVIVLKQGNI